MITIDKSSAGRMPTAFRYALTVIVGILGSALVILNLPLKWRAALLLVVCFVVILAIAQNKKRVLLATVALILPFSVGTGLGSLISREGHVGLSEGIFIQLIDILILALLISHLARVATHRAELRLFPFITVPALAWIFVSALSSINAQDPILTAIQLFHMCRLLLIYLVIANVIEDDVDVKWLIWVMLLGVSFQGVLGTYQAITQQPLGLGFLGEESDPFVLSLDRDLAYRASGTVGHPNGYAMYLATTLPFALALVYSICPRREKLLATIALGTGILGLVFSLSRGGWISFAVAFMIVTGFAVKRGRIHVQGALIVASALSMVLVALALTQPDTITNRITSDDRGSAYSRITLAEGAIAVVKDFPVFGVGLNNQALRVQEYDRVSVASYSGRVVIHNIYLLIAAETGVIGLLAFLWLLASVFANTWRLTTHPNREIAWVAGVGILAGLTALALHGMADYAMLANFSVFNLFWLYAAITASLHSTLRRTSRQNQALTVHP